MDRVEESLTVYFQEPFWVGVIERITENKLSACKVTFGAEPKDYEVYEFLLKYYNHLIFSPAVATVQKVTKQNPKRIHREVQKQLKEVGIGTKSQQALKLQQEQMKLERKETSRERRDEKRQRRFDLKQQKKKDKHRGR